MKAEFPVRKISLFLDELRQLEKRGDRACFIIGAGASFSSGIPTGGAVAKRWIEEIYIRHTDGQYKPEPPISTKDLREWASPDRLNELADHIFHDRERRSTPDSPKAGTVCRPDFNGFDADDPAAFYSALYELRFEHHDRKGHEYLRSLCTDRKPSFGYAVLARILARSRHNVVITVNFDNLIADALAMYEGRNALICGHDRLAEFAEAHTQYPLILKLHSDIFLNPQSRSGEISQLAEGWKIPVREILRNFVPVVIGYGGNDGSLMHFLNALEKRNLRHGILWTHFPDNTYPNKDLVAPVLRRHHGHLIHAPRFDALMTRIAECLGVPVPQEKDVRKRANELVKDFKASLRAAEEELLKSTLPSSAEDPTTVELQRPHGDGTWPTSAGVPQQPKAKPVTKPPTAPKPSASEWLRRVAFASSQEERLKLLREAVEDCPENSTLLRLLACHLQGAKAPAPQVRAYFEAALKASPTDADANGYFAQFLHEDLKDYEQAEKLYQRALELNPTNANHVANYAIFLSDVRKDMDGAEKLYQRSLELAPNHANNNGNYAHFLWRVRKDMDEAEKFFRRALELDPNHANNTTNYATFLHSVRNDMEGAEKLYRRALELDPKHAGNAGNYASFLRKVCKDMDGAEKLYRHALELDPDHATNAGNYANFLREVRKDMGGAEKLYSRALELDPNHVANICNYATFLMDTRKDVDGAEKLFRRAFELNPLHANTAGNYALILHTVRNDMDGAEKLYRRALELDPTDETHTGNFATFLKDVRNDVDGAEKLHLRALELAPSHAALNGNYANFLKDVRKDFNGAEKFYRRALELDPTNALNAGNYAVFLKDIRKDFDEAEKYCRRGLELEPISATHAGNYAECLIQQQRWEDARARLLQFWKNALVGEGQLLPVAALLGLVHRLAVKESPSTHLGVLKHLLNSHVHHGTWSFDEVLTSVKKALSPADHEFCRALASAIRDAGAVAALEQFPRWREAKPIPPPDEL